MASFQSMVGVGRSISPNTASTMPSRRSSRPATWLYSDIASTPNCAAIARMVTPASPFSSASAIAVVTTRSRLSGARFGFALRPVLRSPIDAPSLDGLTL